MSSISFVPTYYRLKYSAWKNSSNQPYYFCNYGENKGSAQKCKHYPSSSGTKSMIPACKAEIKHTAMFYTFNKTAHKCACKRDWYSDNELCTYFAYCHQRLPQIMSKCKHVCCIKEQWQLRSSPSDYFACSSCKLQHVQLQVKTLVETHMFLRIHVCLTSYQNSSMSNMLRHLCCYYKQP